jgi:vacuolar-type H+-ATPase subunit I/STV1
MKKETGVVNFNFDGKEYNFQKSPKIVYVPDGGENIEKIMKDTVRIARFTGKNVRVTFNNQEFVVTGQLKSKEIVNDYLEKEDEKSREWGKSPEGQQAFLEMNKHIEELQQKADTLVELLPVLDFKNQEKVLNWISEFQPPSSCTEVKNHSTKVLRVFMEHGYKPKVNRGKAFNEEDRDNVFRFIVGQALDDLRGSFVDRLKKRKTYIGDIIPTWVKQWNEKFGNSV